MLLTEWNWEDAKKVWQEEAREDGRIEGREEGMKEAILRLLDVMSKEQVAKALQMTLEEIQQILKS